MSLCVLNKFLESLINKYGYEGIEEYIDKSDWVCVKEYPIYIHIDLLRHDHGNGIDKDIREMLRIKISCLIDELKDIFHTIKPIYRIVKDCNTNIHVAMSVNNQNPECFAISKLFPLKEEGNPPDEYFMTVEIYAEGFKELFKVGNVVVVDIAEINFF